MSRSLDFAPLTDPVERGELRAWVAQRRDKAEVAAASPGFRIFFGVLFALILGPIVALLAVMTYGFLFAYNPGSFTWTGATGLSIGLLVVLVIAFGAVRGVLAIWRERGQWAQWFRLDRFAAANGLVFTRRSRGSEYHGSAFEGVDRIERHDHLETKDESRLDYGTVSRITVAGQKTSSREFAYIALYLGHALPHMMLDAKRNRESIALIKNDQVLSLEGDFDQHFTLYAPKGYERDALYIFTPDLMALLIDEANTFDVEIVGKWMMFHSSRLFDLQKPATHERVFRIAETVGAKALRQSDGYSDERSPDRFRIARGGRRLRRAVSISGIVVGILVVLAPFLPLIVSAIEGR